MNDEGALARRPRLHLSQVERSAQPGRPAPRLVLVAELEESLRGRLEADTFEDERRLVEAISSPRARRRLLAAVEDLLDELAGRRAA